MLFGEYMHGVDEKGRIIVPARFREELGETFMVTKGLDNCLSLYSQTEWNEIESRLKALPFSKTRDLRRFLFSGAAEVTADKQGRIVIPPSLRAWAYLEKEAVVIGASNHVEVWDKDRWQAQIDSLTAESIAQAMDELGF